MTFSMFSSVHVDALEWLLNVEDKLAAMEDVERKDLAAAKEQFQRHKAFLFEVEAQDSAIGHVRMRNWFLSII